MLAVKPFTKNRKPKKLKMVLKLNALIEQLIKEHKKNEVLFGVNYDHSWDGYLIRYPDEKLISPNALTTKFDQFV